MKILCIGYRDWSIEIYNKLKRQNKNHDFLIIETVEDSYVPKIKKFNPDMILFYGWSNIIKKEIVDQYKCLMLHPSPLPKYRGGSPIQNQIINGEKKSAISIFIMDQGIDTGPILKQKSFNLSGSIEQIFTRIKKIGYELTNQILSEDLTPTSQDNSKATYYKRRKPSQSEITLEEIKNKSSEYIHNKIRMLEDPYPNAFIKTADGKKVYITKSYIDENDL